MPATAQNSNLFDDDDDTMGEFDQLAFDKACELVRSAEVAGGTWSEALIWLSRAHPRLQPLYDFASTLGAR